MFVFIPESLLVMQSEDCDIEAIQHRLLHWILGSDSDGYEDYGQLGCYIV